MSKHIFWISSYPKSGNTLVRAIISALFFSKNGEFKIDHLKHSTQFERRNRLNLIKKISYSDFLNLEDLKTLSKYWLILQKKENIKIDKGFGFIKSHSSYVSMFNNWFTNQENTAGYIYVLRDPRDIAISWSKHSNLSIDDSIDFMINFNSCIEWAQTDSELPNEIKPKTFLSSWDQHVLSWTNNNLGVPKLILKYEDIVYDKLKSIKIIIKFFEENFNIKLNPTDEKISNVVDSTSFEKLKSHENNYGFEEASSGAFFRKGIKNQWKEELNKKQIVKLENKFRDFMIKYGYD